MNHSESVAKTEGTEPLEFFEAVREKYEQAVAAFEGSVDRFYCIGGLTIRLRFAGAALLPYITPALAHLAIEPVDKCALTICLWDSDSTNILMPTPAWSADDYRERGEIRGFSNDRIHTIFQIGVNALSLLDKERNLGIYWVKTAKQIPYYETGAPLRTIFHLWMSQRGIHLIHAAAVGIPNGGALLVGKGGSGKSTTALACLKSELGYTSDDYCLLTSSPPIPKVFSIYSTGKKNADDLERLPFLAAMISNPDRLDLEKALYFLHEHFPDKLLPSFPLRAILIPRLTGNRETTVTAASPAAALGAIAPSTIFQLPGAGKQVFQAIAQLVKQVNCYYLNLGTDLEQIPNIILSSIETHKNLS